tara:strand:+ start:107 stop:652 length:546 start_codon:yes stop_codon:yes gene_type:complete
MTTSKSIRKEYSNLAEGEELYTRDNLKAIEKIRCLLDDDLVSQLQQFLVLDLRSKLTTAGRERLTQFMAETEAEDDLQLEFIQRLNKIIEKGLVLIQFLASYDLEELTHTTGLTKKWITPEIHQEYLKDNPGLVSILGKRIEREKFKDLLKDSAEDYFVKPYYGTEEKIFIDSINDKGVDD